MDNLNFSLCELPDSGSQPIVYMDINLKGEPLGRIYIRLFRDVFPAGVENFIKIIDGKTCRIDDRQFGKYKLQKQVRRTYQDCKFYNFLFNNYIIAGDIYNNDGSNAGTIYSDEPIPCEFGEHYYPHDKKGLISLVPFQDENNGLTYYDSTFMITLADNNPYNNLMRFDTQQIVIGQVYDGLRIIDKMNELIKPFAGRKYPDFRIAGCGIHRTHNTRRRPNLAIDRYVNYDRHPNLLNIEQQNIKNEVLKPFVSPYGASL